MSSMNNRYLLKIWLFIRVLIIRLSMDINLLFSNLGCCKYTRRNEKEKMKWCVMEMALFNEHSKGQWMVTNLINS